MIYSDVIIVGGGPAGSTCAWKLQQHNISSIILDKETFPRPKVCAGWITPIALRDLQIKPDDYPYSITVFTRITYFFWSIKVPVRTRQYAIRRIEFDHWLLKRANVAVHHHHVSEIRKEDSSYVIDGRYRCRYLVGAGGTHCPVNRSFFASAAPPRGQRPLIAAVEDEVLYPYNDSNCYLWFFDNGLPGYAWYLPKQDGYINVGIGGRLSTLKKKRTTIRRHWDRFVEKLEKLSLVKGISFNPKGHTYYLRDQRDKGQIDNVFIIGDAAGLATVDMGEGIGPAVESGLLAAQAIREQTSYAPRKISRYSFKNILFPGRKQPW